MQAAPLPRKRIARRACCTTRTCTCTIVCERRGQGRTAARLAQLESYIHIRSQNLHENLGKTDIFRQRQVSGWISTLSEGMRILPPDVQVVERAQAAEEHGLRALWARQLGEGARLHAARTWRRRLGGSLGRLRRRRQGCDERVEICLLYTSPSPRDRQKSRMPSSA